MTPLITEMVGLIPDEAVNYQWFDASATYSSEITISDDEEITGKLPFPQMAIVTVDDQKTKILLMLKQQGDYVGVLGYALTNKGYGKIKPFVYKVIDGQIGVKLVDGKPFDYRKEENVTAAIAIISQFLKSLRTQIEGYTPIKRANHDKKIRQGKTPLFDWTTVIIKPGAAKSEHQSGTHASPRLHDRRGHWRHIKKTDKRVWVRNCKVGDAAKGAIFHDYKVET
jgi:hypothetical protein